jgi:type IV secretion system protein VirB9
VLISPLAPGLETNLVVHTSRRMYQLELCSSADQYMPAVAFQYQDEVEAHFAALRAREGSSSARGTSDPASDADSANEGTDGPMVDPGGLDFGYEVELQGRRRARRAIDWAPLRAYSDGHRTIIEMPREMLRRDAPILLLRENGEDRIVNFRLRGRYFIVDRIFREAQLIRGVGRDQQRVIVRRVDR